MNAKRAKQFFARLGMPITRMLVRTLPSRRLVLRLLEDVFAVHLAWRPFETTTSTRDGLRMRIRLPDQIQERIYLFGVWEPAITRFVKGRLKPGDLFVDIGANVGYYSLFAAKLVGSEGRVIAVEASPTIARTLEQNVALNRLTNVELVRAAVADRRKTVPMFAAGNSGQSTTIVSTAERRGYQLEAQIEAYPLHELIDFERLRRARLIKVDVEGAEAQLFDGIQPFLSSFSDETEWIFELTPEALAEQGRSAAEIIRMFAGSGYRLYRIENVYRMEGYVRPPNAVLEQITDMPGPGLTVDVVATRKEQRQRVEF